VPRESGPKPAARRCKRPEVNRQLNGHRIDVYLRGTPIARTAEPEVLPCRRLEGRASLPVERGNRERGHA